ncbi:hypothetical protein LAU_0094 [Lausannevirus]|uniref:Uncharacterized protein n=1 Tax=Lausannevirus TaxID=999883 RepID=F2WL24_9VIRU|nr:hypothetical protein LAU_0094 [Lausannevirus]AEA06947.1 hypothetical protein LAU_0094 [Lausannevirus]
MDEEQKEHILSLLEEAWKVKGVVSFVEKRDGKIVKASFEKDKKDIANPLCWCGSSGCQDCKRTKSKEDDEFFRCRLTCNNVKRCYLCESNNS